MAESRPLNLVILEDSADDAALMVAQLEREGLSIRAERVESEAAFLHSLEKGPDAILSDCGLPKFSGQRALALLRKQDDDLPFIVVSGTIGEETAVEMMRAGASDYFLKSGNLARLAPALVREVNDAREKRARRLAEKNWRLAEQAIANAAEAIFITDCELRIISVNDAFIQITGYGAEDVIGSPIPGVVTGAYPATFRDDLYAALDLEGRWQGELINYRKDGESYSELLSVSAIRDDNGRVTHLVGAANDITAYKQYEAKLDFLAHFDPVTELPNRRTLQKDFELARGQAKRTGRNLSVLFLDLDNFKSVNDSMGHAVGDKFLKAIADRLKSCLRTGDTVARLAGDEFVILATNLSSVTDATVVSNKLIDALRMPFRVQGREMFTTASIGISIYPRDGADFEELLTAADSAMYRAKQTGRNAVFVFNADQDDGAHHYFDTVTALHRAVDKKEFILDFQPCVHMSTGTIHSLEALIRWRRPGFGVVPPGEFIPIAEQSGLINEIGEWVLQEACDRAVAWRAISGDLPPVAVNVSARQFRRPDFSDYVRDVMAQSGLSPDRLILEITETAVMEDPRRSGRILSELHDLGVKVAIDDFGTGYSSLVYLTHFPVDYLKVDRTFVATLPEKENTSSIAATIVNMARGLRLTAIAEGVETEIQKNCLLQHGCTLGQGFLFSHPLSTAQTRTYLASRLP